jgi:hypothetical protein
MNKIPQQGQKVKRVTGALLSTMTDKEQEKETPEGAAVTPDIKQGFAGLG